MTETLTHAMCKGGAVTTADVNGPRWSAGASVRAELYAHMSRPAWQAVADATGIGDGTRVLDIACGSGEFCRLAAERGASVSGIDAAEGMIEIARAMVPGDFLVGPMERLPWSDGEFDLVTGFNAFQMAADMVVALAEARRVTRARGRVAICNWGRREDCQLRSVSQAIVALAPTPPPVTPGFGEPGVLEDLAHRAGLTPGETGEVDVPWSPPDLDTLQRALLSAGGGVLATVEHVGENTVRQVIAEAAAPYRRADGSYRFENKFRYLITSN
jgi:SAM-dependent methyltransferase